MGKLISMELRVNCYLAASNRTSNRTSYSKRTTPVPAKSPRNSRLEKKSCVRQDPRVNCDEAGGGGGVGGRSEPKPKPLCASHCKPCHLHHRHHRHRHRHHHHHHGHIAIHTIVIITTVIIVLVVVIFVGNDDFGGKSCCMGRLAVPWQPIFPHAGPSGSNTSPNQAGGSAGGCCTVC